MTRAAVLALGLVCLACESGEPTPAPTQAPVEVGGQKYIKPEGRLLDVPRMLDRPLSVVEGSELGLQLGARVEEVRLPGVRGIQLSFEKATVAVAKGKIYYITYTFDPPVNRAIALQQMGLPGSLSPLRARAEEFRIERPLHNVRRVVLTRAAPESEEVVKLEIWSLLPGETY